MRVSKRMIGSLILGVMAFVVLPGCPMPDEEKNPEWLEKLIERIEGEPVANPPAQIAQYAYDGQTVYYQPPRCCDIMSDLYDSDGNIICNPDGGIDGGGDGRCPDFFEEAEFKRLVWQDQRTQPSGMDFSQAKTIEFIYEPGLGFCPPVDVVFSATITMDESGGYMADIYILESELDFDFDFSECPPNGIEPECVGAIPLGLRSLRDDEVDMLKQVLSAVEVDDDFEVDPNCGAVDPCAVPSVCIDELCPSQFPCSTVRFSEGSMGSIIDMLEKLRNE